MAWEQRRVPAQGDPPPLTDREFPPPLAAHEVINPELSASGRRFLLLSSLVPRSQEDTGHSCFCLRGACAPPRPSYPCPTPALLLSQGLRAGPISPSVTYLPPTHTQCSLVPDEMDRKSQPGMLLPDLCGSLGESTEPPQLVLPPVPAETLENQIQLTGRTMPLALKSQVY